MASLSAPVRKSAVRMMMPYLQHHPQALPAVRELGRAYFSPTVSGWSQAQSDIDLEISRAELGQESAAAAMHDAEVKVQHDISTAGWRIVGGGSPTHDPKTLAHPLAKRTDHPD